MGAWRVGGGGGGGRLTRADVWQESESPGCAALVSRVCRACGDEGRSGRQEWGAWRVGGGGGGGRLTRADVWQGSEIHWGHNA